MHQQQRPEQETFWLHAVQRPCTANNASRFSTVAKNDAVPNLTPQALGGHELYTARRMLNTAYRTQRYGVGLGTASFFATVLNCDALFAVHGRCSGCSKNSSKGLP